MTLALFAVAAMAVQYLSCLLACRAICSKDAWRQTPQISSCADAVTLVRPLCGLEPFSRRTIAASFAQDYPHYEVLFCVASAEDPVVPLAKEAIAAHPRVRARLLVGDDRISGNPKLNNMAKGLWNASHPWIVFCDSNVQMPPSYLRQVIGAFGSGTGAVSAPAFGSAAVGLPAEVECSMLNAFQARIQYAVAALGFGFAQGKTLAYRTDDLHRAGIEALAIDSAEDAATTKVVRARGERIAIAAPPPPQLLGRKTWRQVWSRHLRWARLRRASFPLYFAPEILAGGLPPLLDVLALGTQTGISLPGLTIVWLILWYGPELFLTARADWPLNARTPLTMLLRDAMLPALYVGALLSRTVQWHGKPIEAAPAEARQRRLSWRAYWRISD